MVWAAVVWSSEGKSPSSRHGQNLQSQRGLAFGLGPLFLGGEIRNLPGEVLPESRGQRISANGREDRRGKASRRFAVCLLCLERRLRVPAGGCRRRCLVRGGLCRRQGSSLCRYLHRAG